MNSVNDVRQLLSEVYGIKTERDLDRELLKIGGIKIGIFTEKTKTHQKEHEAKEMVQ